MVPPTKHESTILFLILIYYQKQREHAPTLHDPPNGWFFQVEEIECTEPAKTPDSIQKLTAVTNENGVLLTLDRIEEEGRRRPSLEQFFFSPKRQREANSIELSFRRSRDAFLFTLALLAAAVLQILFYFLGGSQRPPFPTKFPQKGTIAKLCSFFGRRVVKICAHSRVEEWRSNLPDKEMMQRQFLHCCRDPPLLFQTLSSAPIHFNFVLALSSSLLVLMFMRPNFF